MDLVADKGSCNEQRNSRGVIFAGSGGIGKWFLGGVGMG